MHKRLDGNQAVLPFRRQSRQQRLFIVKHRKAIKPAPDAGRCAALQPDSAVRCLRPQQGQRHRAALELAGLDRIGLRFALGETPAQGLHRAQQTCRLAGCAHRGAQVHQTLRVTRHRRVQLAPRQQRSGNGLQFARRSAGPQIAGKRGYPRQYTFDVAVKNRHPLGKAKSGNRRGCGWPDTGQGLQQLGRLRKLAPMQLHNILCAAVQIAGAAVVTQAAPQAQHLIQRRCCQISDRRETQQKPPVIVQHRDHLGLLQHDFRQPDAIRVARVLPGQAVASMAFLPAHHMGRKLRQKLAGKPRPSCGQGRGRVSG